MLGRTAVLLVALLPVGCGAYAFEQETGVATQETQATQTQEEAAVAPGALPQIREDFELNFGGAGDPALAVSWYTPSSTLSIEGSTLVARTDFYPDAEGEALAKQLCNALNGNYVLANTANYGLDAVEVYGQGTRLASASGGGTC